jgi:hypothetical protein
MVRADGEQSLLQPDREVFQSVNDVDGNLEGSGNEWSALEAAEEKDSDDNSDQGLHLDVGLSVGSSPLSRFAPVLRATEWPILP